MRSLFRFLARWQNLLGVLIVGGFIVVAIAAPQIAPPDDPINPEPFKRVGRASDLIPHPPSATAPLGTTAGQSDMLYSIVWGTRSALSFGLIVTLSTATFGVLVGALSGYSGRVLNGIVMRTIDALLAFPVIAGVWLFQQILFPPSPPFQPPNQLTQPLQDLGLTPVMMALLRF